MTLTMLDTNIVSDMMRNPRGKVADHIARVGDENLCISVITAAELRSRRGYEKRIEPHLERVEAILARVLVLPLAPLADAQYSGIRAELEAAGHPIGPTTC